MEKVSINSTFQIKLFRKNVLRGVILGFALVFSMICLSTQSVMGKDKIEWSIFDWSPGFIVSGPNKGQGFADLARDMVIAELPNYEHEVVSYPLARLKHDIKLGEKPGSRACTGSLPEILTSPTT